MDTEKLRKRYAGPMMNQDIMDCIEEIERLSKILQKIWGQMCEMLEEQAKEIEKSNKLLSVEQISNQGKQEEIERLRKEKEWLIGNICLSYIDPAITVEEAKKDIITNMQHALKEK